MTGQLKAPNATPPKAARSHLPATTDPSTAVVSMRFTTAELDVLESLANEAGIAVTAYLRGLITAHLVDEVTP